MQESPRRVRTAVIGAGGFGRHHCRIYGELPEASLAAIVDRDPETRARAAGQYGVPVLADASELPPDVEAVSVAVPTQFHHAVALPLLRRGVSVLIEKPMVRDLDEGRELIEAAERSGAVLQVGHVERFNPAVRALEAHDIRPRFIEAARVAPFSFRSVDVGVVMDLMIHDIDIVLSLARSRPLRVEAVGVPVLTEHEDIANARVVFENGCVATLTASRVATKTERKVRVFSGDSYLIVDFGKREGWLYRKGPGLTPDAVRAFAAGGKSVQELQGAVFTDLIRMEKLETPQGDPLTEEIRDFLRCVRDREKPRVGGREGLEAVSLALEVLRSLRRGENP
ncbi:MAG: Inositol 2-dehydrogenase/D-chiro-inositol 3-dehydrogenase [Planctomycetes bacterium]|nr:Inositol 2-dehydrogenase/D-chiro-inositol 3-dehydrogenase [Planctomycetota bacterium]